ncbi:hypothetical protein G7Y89_g11770 [Cudoniella acicularis]|uniref:Heterokaryon incompatibility domain-containing protein n=1 Tax=Cudoniella acicularis TaxID=354080 RepID=A0A8H4RDY0_9HELO|nr:hypothetical protein G7Y89_g11770 [Cudoniella acicularis]
MPRCEICSSFALTDRFNAVFTHQPNVRALVSSAALGCELCQFLYKQIQSSSSPVSRSLASLVANQMIDSVIRLYRTHEEVSPNKLRVQVGSEEGNCISLLICSRDGQYCGGFLYTIIMSMNQLTDTDDPSSKHIRTREVFQDPDCDDLYKTLACWISHCQNRHSECYQRLATLPTRVVDVGTPDGSRQPRLVVSEGRLGRYTTLSYRWGRKGQLVTRVDNFEAHCNQIELSSLSETTRDAIKITQRLGFQYLWVDALCIIQDSPDNDDWETQSSKMREIYTNSCITIQAAIPEDCTQRILHQRPVIESINVPFQLADGSPCGVVQLVQPADRGSRPLDQRAWTFQEAELAFRTISFRRDHIVFRCQYGLIVDGERGLSSTGEPIFTSHAATNSKLPTQLSLNSTPQALRKWYWDIPGYSYRRCTKEDDILPAISGLTKDYQRCIPGRYLAGLWETDLLYGLQWRSHPRWPTRRLLTRAPSWSWASIEGYVQYYWPWQKRENCEYESAVAISKVLEASVATTTKDPNGRVSGGKITLEGPIRCAQWARSEIWKEEQSRKDSWNPWDGTALFDHEGIPSQPEKKIPFFEHPAEVEKGIAPFAVCLFDEDDVRPHYIECLLLSTRQGIMLHPVEGEERTYRRVGFFRMNGFDAEWQEQRAIVNII